MLLIECWFWANNWEKSWRREREKKWSSGNWSLGGLVVVVGWLAQAFALCCFRWASGELHLWRVFCLCVWKANWHNCLLCVRLVMFDACCCCCCCWVKLNERLLSLLRASFFSYIYLLKLGKKERKRKRKKRKKRMRWACALVEPRA